MIIHDVWSLDKYTDELCKLTYIKAMSVSDRSRSDVQTDSSGDESRRRQSIARSKARVLELALCNKWSYFCTFTQNENLRNRYDLAAFSKDFTQFIANLNRERKTKIRYVLVPEQHKDGAWHMHGLIAGLSKKTDLVKNEHGYLDWMAYSSRYGFFSCSPVRSPRKCATYVSKYISKQFWDNPLPKGGHLYYASHGLKGKERLINLSDDLGLCPLKWTAEEKQKHGVFENDYVMTAWVNLHDLC